jgi:beta-lactamase class A
MTAIKIRHRTFKLLLLSALLASCAAFGEDAAIDGNDAAIVRLKAEIEEIAGTSGGRVGVAARHVESGRRIELNGAERFPMASTFKVPVAIQFLTLVEQGSVSLDKVVTLKPGDLRPGSGKLADTFDESHATFSLQQLFERMLIDSDNTATDVIWKEAGGREAVGARLASLGIRGISADRPTVDFLAASWGIEPLPPENEWTLARFRELRRAVPGGVRNAAAAAFFKDDRDTATPDAMVELLLKIWRNDTLSHDSTAYLLGVMYRCATGKGRLKGMLPSEAKVAHKTGSLEIGVTNDVGIIQLPGGAGTIVIAVMVRESRSRLAVQERAIARITWAIYQYFVQR